jgi:hypothetical protein
MTRGILFPDRPASNGRVDTTENDNFAIFDLYKNNVNSKGNNTSFATEAITNIHVKNDVSSVFFNDTNINVVHEAIRYYVWKKSCGKYVIDRQNDDEIKIVMRSVYLNHAQHAPTDILTQVKELNLRVINYCVDRVLQEIGMYLHYKTDISRLPDPMARGQFASSKGEKNDQLKAFF